MKSFLAVLAGLAFTIVVAVVLDLVMHAAVCTAPKSVT